MRRKASRERRASGSRYDRGVPTLAELARDASSCTRCPLAVGRTNVVFGAGDPDADVLFVGEGPGAEEDLRGLPFVGRSGQLLDRLMLEEMGLSRARGVYIANVVMCRPPGNRNPEPPEIAACRPWLDAKVAQIRPRVIVTLGNFATQLLLETTSGIKSLRGRVYPHASGAVVVPTYHPSFVLRSGGAGAAAAEMRADLVRAKEQVAVAA